MATSASGAADVHDAAAQPQQDPVVMDMRAAMSVAASRQRQNVADAAAAALPPGKKWFVPAADGSWRSVGSDEICEGGLEYRVDFSTGSTLARLSGGAPRTKLAPALAALATPAAARAEASGREHGDGTLSVGQKVAVLFLKGRREGTTEDATIRKVNEDGSVNVEFDITGDRETGVSADRVQPRSQ